MDSRIILKALDHFGDKSQISKAIEEMAELTTELARQQNSKGMSINIIEEIADVAIMLEQLKYIFGEPLVSVHIERKLKRLEGRIDSSLQSVK
jgi:NTP pyrophosphatase (non-canonical NTP hydrolase)